ncbi:ABC transporter permease [Candidatus Obscuribacterales bacterium]|nr:ABC transporter permease [Candidatus Obscuribacterales bacterium]MBX3149459.1 ABC transporter permease [Candidatus Obscuribacterales bacterium]
MNTSIKRFPGADIFDWISPVGASVRLMFGLLSLQGVKELDWAEMRGHCRWMGLQSFHFVSLSAALVAIALTIETVVELQKFQAQDISGAAISIGLLREIGPLTISAGWCAMVAARLAEEAKVHYPQYHSDRSFSQGFILPRLICALGMSLPLGAYGLLFGFLTGALFAPLIGVTSTADFLESARLAIHDKDIAVYFIKLVLVNPTVGVFAGTVCGMAAKGRPQPVAASAVSATLLVCFALNLFVTVAAYLQGEPNL